MTRARPVVGISLKAYFDRDRLDTWAAEVGRRAVRERWSDAVDVFVLPDLLGVGCAVAHLAGTGVVVGAQDVSASGWGATTGDVPAARLAEEGCTLAAVGHAERRAGHGETDAVVAAKVEQLVLAGLTPLVCVGELDPATASQTCLDQLTAALVRCPEDRAVIVAYEPVWAIGASRPADAAHVRSVVGALRQRFAGRPLSFVYGGSAMPGLLGEIGDAVDGLFLGRFGHDPQALGEVVAEARSLRAPTKPS